MSLSEMRHVTAGNVVCKSWFCSVSVKIRICLHTIEIKNKGKQWMSNGGEITPPCPKVPPAGVG